MRLQLAASRLRRVPVVRGSAVVFIALAVLIYWLYFINKESVYLHNYNENLAALYALFYLAFAVHLFASIVVAVALTLWTKAPTRRTLVGVAVTYAVLMLPLMYIMSGLNVCVTGESFPIPGIPCDD